MIGRILTAAVLAAGLAQAAHGQPASDPIATVLESATPAPAAPPVSPPVAVPSAAAPDEEAAEMMGSPPVAIDAPVPPPAPAAVMLPPQPPQPSAPPSPATAPYAPFPSYAGQPYARPPQTYPAPPPAYARPGPSTAKSPVYIHETSRTPDRPLTAYDMGYDARLRASSASAQGMQGALDGSWTLNAPGVGDIYVLELVDRGVGPLEGAWRDLRRLGSLGGSGFVDQIERYGSTLTVRFSPSERIGVATATLNAQPDGRWSGELAERGERKSVILRRN